MTYKAIFELDEPRQHYPPGPDTPAAAETATERLWSPLAAAVVILATLALGVFIGVSATVCGAYELFSVKGCW